MIPNELFTERTKIQHLHSGEVALVDASFPASGSYIDVSQYKSFVFLINAGALTSALSFQVQQATANNGTLKDVTGAVVAVPANGDDKWYSIEVQASKLDINNDYRYVTLTMTGAAGGDDYADLLFFGINASLKPVTQGSDKGTIVSLVG
jgi:hypothetical protein